MSLTKKITNSEEEASTKKTAVKKTAAKITAKKPAAKKTTEDAGKMTEKKTVTKKTTVKKTTGDKAKTIKKTVHKAAEAETQKTHQATTHAPKTQTVNPAEAHTDKIETEKVAHTAPVHHTPAQIKPAPAPEASKEVAPAVKPAQAYQAPRPVHPQAAQPAPRPQQAAPLQTAAPVRSAQQQPSARPVNQTTQTPQAQKPAVNQNLNRHGQVKQDVPTAAAEPSKKIKIVGQPTVKELAEKMSLKINDFIKKLMGLGFFATINQRLEKDVIQLVVGECGYEADMQAEELNKETLSVMETQDDPSTLKPRSAVITIMGHVDHGKTSLLDAIRSSHVVDGEAGAITQHIGAYRVKTAKGSLTFLDTPGHEAFTAMRARGAQATDIVILVVSATDGIMPQTIEAMEHAKAAGAPIIVAVNKIDLPGANVDRVKQDLASRGLVPEDWQGNTIYVEISAKKRINIDKLLEMIALQAEIMELKANPDRLGVGVILESKRDNKRGVVATVLVQKGTMKVGDPFIVGTTSGRIRALVDENSQRYQKIGPSVPAEILGISGEPPQVGDILYIMESEKEARYAAEKRKLAQKEDSQAHRKHVSLMNLRKDDGTGNTVKKLQLILKADVQGSIEAIKDALLRIPSDEVELDLILSAPGNINESDILLAKASNAVVIGFHVDVENKAQAEAEHEGIEIRQYTIIFELLEDIRAAMEGLLEPDVVEVLVGSATIRKVLRLSSGLISGSMVDIGKMIRGHEIRIKRAGEEVAHGKIGGLKRFKDDVKEVEKGYECGILVEGFKGVQEGDVIECIRHDHVTRRIKM